MREPNFAFHIPGGKDLFDHKEYKTISRVFPHSDMFSMSEVERMKHKPSDVEVRDIKSNRNLGKMPLSVALLKLR